jgi:hypothetical protein
LPGSRIIALSLPPTVEQFVESGALEDLVNPRVKVAQDQLTARRFHPLIQRDEFPQEGAIEVLDASEVQHQLGLSPFGHYAVQLFGNGLDGLPDQDLLIGEANQRHVANLLHFEVTAV